MHPSPFLYKQSLRFILICVLCFGHFTIQADGGDSHHPLHQFVGQWIVDDTGFSMVWDTKTVQTFPLDGQVSRCQVLNTSQSMLCKVDNDLDATANSGNIYWSWDPNTKVLYWLSHFAPSRYGAGRGTVDDRGNLSFKVSFSDEPEGTYRVYRWVWHNDGSYQMISHQYDANHIKTGNWYGGRFVRLLSNHDEE